MSHSKIKIDFTQPQVMAILNVTPDSFYRNSRTFTAVEIQERVGRIITEGASIIDVGGYSSRPNAVDIPTEEEWSRVERGIAIIRKIAPDIAISVDTFRSDVAEKAILKFGDIIINDISAGEMDCKMIAVAARYKVPYIAMHMRGTPQTMQQDQNISYDNLIDEITRYFRLKISELCDAGIENIIIDPGFGFAKNLDQNYSLMASLNQLCDLGYPVLVGVSRKSMIYNLLSCSAEDALSGTIALNYEALRQGATILRVHDVRAASDSVKIFKKILQI